MSIEIEMARFGRDSGLDSDDQMADGRAVAAASPQLLQYQRRSQKFWFCIASVLFSVAIFLYGFGCFRSAPPEQRVVVLRPRTPTHASEEVTQVSAEVKGSANLELEEQVQADITRGEGVHPEDPGTKLEAEKPAANQPGPTLTVFLATHCAAWSGVSDPTWLYGDSPRPPADLLAFGYQEVDGSDSIDYSGMGRLRRPTLKTTTVKSPWCRYETALHVAVSDSSLWTFENVPYISAGCRPSRHNFGCIIYNNNLFECNKETVNILVLNASLPDGRSVKLCLLNVHGGRNTNTDDRAADLASAMLEVESAGCQAHFVVGNMNSRFHCEDPGSAATQPLRNRPLAEVIAAACPEGTEDGGNCSMGKGTELGTHDELTRILDSRTLSCFDSEDKLRSMPNRLSYWAECCLEEAGPIKFAPTYRVETPARAQNVAEALKVCPVFLPNECFVATSSFIFGMNKQHNAAYPDRILKGTLAQVGGVTNDKESIKLKTLAYDRVKPPVDANGWMSSHSAVTAVIEMQIPSGMGAQESMQGSPA